MESTSISGVPEWLPEGRMLELSLIDAVRTQFEVSGFQPIETPALERLSVLDERGGAGRQIYRVSRLGTVPGDISAGLHFDLTVPLLRYVLQHQEHLRFPFRSYQIQKVWRADRPQRGRYREFYQCDADVVGRSALDGLYDAEMTVVAEAALAAIGAPNFRIHLSHRRILGALFDAWGVQPLHVSLLRIVDKYRTSVPETVLQGLVNVGLSLEQAERLVELMELADSSAIAAILRREGADASGVTELAEVVQRAADLGMPPDRLLIDLSIARGLQYYSGTMFEAYALGHESWGSLCGGGRYDGLATYFGSKRAFPGTGLSIGLTRVLALLMDLDPTVASVRTPTKVLVAVLDRALLPIYVSLAATLRAAGVPTQVHFQPSSLREQLSSASREGIPLVLMVGQSESTSRTVLVRHMSSGTQAEVPMDDIGARVKESLEC